MSCSAIVAMLECGSETSLHATHGTLIRNGSASISKTLPGFGGVLSYVEPFEHAAAEAWPASSYPVTHVKYLTPSSMANAATPRLWAPR